MKKILFTVFLLLFCFSHSWANNRYIQSDKSVINFGVVPYNSLLTQDIILTNPGGDTQTDVTKIYLINYPSSFTITMNDAPPTRVVPPSTVGGSLTVRVQAFIYQDVGTFNDTLVIENNSLNAPVLKIPVTITINPQTEPFSWNKSFIDFGTVRNDIEDIRDTVTFSTSSLTGLDILEIYLANEETDFGIFLTTAPPACTLLYGIPVRIGVRYSPFWTGEYFDTLIVKTSSTPTYVRIPLRVNVVEPGPYIHISKSELDFGTSGFGEAYKEQTFNVQIQTINPGKINSLETNSKDILIDNQQEEKTNLNTKRKDLFIQSAREARTVTFSGYSLDIPDSLFVFLEKFPFTIQEGEIKTLTARFYPNRTGFISNVLRLPNTSGNLPNAGINVYAQVIGSSITVQPSSIDLGTVGLNSAPKDTFFTITNSGLYKLIISSLTEFVADSVFRLLNQVSPNSTVTLDPGQTYKVNVRLNPYQLGLKKDSINVINNSESNPTKRVVLSANIINPNLSISPSEINFGESSLLQPSKDTTIRVTNNGTSVITISKTRITGDTASFRIKSGLNNVTLAAGKTENLVVTFNPVSAGAKTGMVEITGNDPLGNRRLINLSGVGGGKAILSSDKQSIDFGDMNAGTSRDTLIIIQNLGNLNLSITSKTFTGNDNALFSFVSGGSPVQVLSGKNDSVRVRVTGMLPSGVKNAQLSLASNDPDKPLYNISLSTKVKAPIVTRTPDRITYDTLAVGSYKDSTIQITNSGNSALLITGIFFDGGFSSDFSAEAYNFPIIVQPGAAFNFNFRFRPLGAGLRFARIVIQSNDPATPETYVILVGNSKVFDQPDIYVAISSLDFGKTLINSIKDTTFTVSNSGTQRLIVDSLKLEGLDKNYFVISGFSLPILLDPGKDQKISLQFLPTLNDTNKIYSATIRIKSNDPNNSILYIPVTGSGKQFVETGLITYSPSSINFGNVNLYGFRDTVITLTNTASSIRNIDSLNITGADAVYFSIQTQFPVAIGPNSSKTVTVRFSPVLPDLQKTYSALLRIKTNDPKISLIQINLSGKGIQSGSALFVSPLQIDFGKRTLYYTKEDSIKIRNIGFTNLSINSIILEGTDTDHIKITSSVTTPFSLSSLEEKTVKLQFTPKSIGQKQVILKISSSDPVSPNASVTVKGEGINPVLNLVTSVNFGNVGVNKQKDTIIIVKNQSEGAFEITNVSISGNDQTSFSIDPRTNLGVLNPSESDTIYCKFSPTAKGEKNAFLNITINNMPSANSIVNLTGAGVAQQITINPNSLIFGKVTAGTNKDTTFTIGNSGNWVLRVNSISLSGANSQNFSLSGFTTPFDIVAGGTKIVTVRYISSVSGLKNATVTITSDDPDSPTKTISLSAETEAVATIINQTPDNYADFGQDKQISFALSHQVATNYVQVFYKPGGSSKYDSANASVAASGYSFTFNKNLVTSRGLDYYIKVTTPTGIITYPETNYIENPLHIRVRIPVFNVPNELKGSVYSMLSIPFDFGASNFRDEMLKLFGSYDPYTWRIFYWQNGAYVELSETNNISLKAGDGFWIIYSKNQTISFSNIVSTPANEPYKITLKPGWNQIGNPFMFAVPLTAISIPAGKNVENILWKWESEKYTEESASLAPFTGYFILNNEPINVDILVYPIIVPVIAGKSGVPNQTSNIENSVKITANDETGKTDNVRIGIISMNKLSNYSKPPFSPGKTLDLRILEGAKEYASYFKDLSNGGAVWSVRLSNLVKGKKYSVSFEPGSEFIKSFSIAVINSETGEKVRLINNRINFTASSALKEFKIIAGEKAFIDKEIAETKITDFKLSQNYPNPFNPSTRIEFTLKEPSNVIIRVFNQLGQEVGVIIKEYRNAGAHSVTWEAGKAPSGIYYYELSAGGYKETKRMMLIK